MPTKKRERVLRRLEAKRDKLDQVIQLVKSADDEVMDLLASSLDDSNPNLSEVIRPQHSKDESANTGPNNGRKSLTTSVRSVVNPMELGRKFDVNDVYEVLKHSVDFSTYPRPKAAIGDVLRKLVGKSSKILKQGSGRIATIYQKVE